MCAQCCDVQLVFMYIVCIYKCWLVVRHVYYIPFGPFLDICIGAKSY